MERRGLLATRFYSLVTYIKIDLSNFVRLHADQNVTFH